MPIIKNKHSPGSIFQNSHVKKLRPSVKPHKISLYIKSFLNKIAPYFKTQTAHLNKERFIQLMTKSHPFSFDTLQAFYADFLSNKKECPPSLKKNLNELKRFTKKLEKIQSIPQVPLQERAEKILEASLASELKALKPKETRLFALGERDQVLFCKITKQENQQFTLLFLGSFEEMKDLTDISFKSAGKEKTQRELVIENVASLDDLMPHFLNKATKEPLKAILQRPLFKETHIKSTQTEFSSTIQTISSKVFWNLFTSYSPNDQKKIKLRAELTQLFEIYQLNYVEMGRDPKVNLEITRLLMALSKKTLIAYEKNYISKEEMEEVRKELDVISEKLKTIKIKNGNRSLNKISTSSFIIKGSGAPLLKKQEPLSQPLASVKVEDRSIGKVPNLTLETMATKITPIILNPYPSIETKEVFLKTIETLHKNYSEAPTIENEQEFLSFIRDVPLSVFQRKKTPFEHKRDRDETSFWWHLTAEEGQQVIKIISETTKKITLQPTLKARLSQGNFEALLKSNFLIYFLEFKIHGYSPSTYGLSEMFENYRLFEPFNRQSLGHNFRRTEFNSGQFFSEISGMSSGIQDMSQGSHVFYKDFNNHFKTFKAFIGGDSSLKQLFTPSLMHQWIRPINHPFLFSIYRQVASSITREDSYYYYGSQSTTQGHEEQLGLMSPEAMHDNPTGVFFHFLDAYQEEIKGMNDSYLSELYRYDINVKENLFPPSTLEFSIDAQKRLLRLLRLKSPQIELMAFLEESMHLLYNPSVRNFFDVLFFNGTLTELLNAAALDSVHNSFIAAMPSQIDRHIQNLKQQFHEAKKGNDIELAKKRFDTLLYLLEMQEKLKQIYSTRNQALDFQSTQNLSLDGFPDNEEALLELKEVAFKNNDFDAMGIIARIDQRRLLAKGTIDETNLAPILQNFILIWGSSTNPENIDPTFDSQLRSVWEKLLKNLDQETKKELLPTLLDHFVYTKNLKVDGSPWGYTKDNIFVNQLYKIDLDLLSIVTLEENQQRGVLPYSIQDNPLFAKAFPDLKASFPVQMETKDTVTVYFFQDVSGMDCRIEQIKNQIFIYKQMKVDEKEQWLLYVPIEAQAKLPLEVKKSKNPFQILKNLEQAYTHLNANDPTLPFLKYNQLYINPETLSGILLDDHQKPLFKVMVKNGKDRITLSSVTDLREKEPSTWQVNHAGPTQHPLIQELSKIDRPENILLWQRNKGLKKIELYRYGLQFAVEGNRLKCLNKEYAGYYLKTDATLQDKNQFAHSLLLEHTDPTKPKKLIVPDPAALQMDKEHLLPHAKGIARLIYLLKQLIQLFKGTFNIEKVGVIKPTLSFDNTLKTISYKAYDLRAYTNEICQKEKAGLEGFLERMQHALITQQFEKAHEHFLKYEWESITGEKLNKISAFLQHSSSGSNIESALKLKMIFKLYTHLKENTRLTKSVKNSLEQLILKETKLYLAAGRRIPLSLELTEDEKLRAFHISKTLDPNYADENIPLEDDLEVVNTEYKAKKQKILTIQAKIGALETRIPLQDKLTDEELTAQIHRLSKKDQAPLLFAEEKIKHLFNAHQTVLPPLKLNDNSKLSPAERIGIKTFQEDLDRYALKEGERFRYEAKSPALKAFIKKELLPLKASYEAKLIKFQSQVEQLIHTSANSEEQLRILAKEQDVASFDEIRIAFSNGTLQALKDKQRLPQTINLAALTAELTNYFDALSHRNALSASLDLAESMLKTKTQNKKLWESQSTALEKLLTMKRGYDATKDPRLLVFEAQQFNFRFIDGGIHQVEMLEAFLSNPFGIIQAPTGAGKSTFSNLRALLKPNGKNLVIQCVLPPLFEQAYHKMNEVIGDLYGTHVYALKYRPSQVHTYRELVKYEENGEKKERFENVSIFKKMYLELLQTIENKGCVLTDYTSFPMLEEKYFKILDTMAEKKESKEAIDPMLIEHYNYLRKILILKDNRSDMLMDEFDLPNRPTQKIQLDLGVGSKDLPPFIADTSLQIFEILAKDPSLGLLKNIQGDINPKIREECIQNAAAEMATRLSQGEGEAFQKSVLDYFLGKNKDIIPLMKDKDKSYRDQITLCKDQFTIYLPLTLSWNRTTRYDRSDDQRRTLPASKGDKREAKFGTILEQMNVRIQDYLQGGVAEYDVLPWFKKRKEAFDNADEMGKIPIKAQIARIFPGKEVREIAAGLENPSTTLIQEINQDIEKVKFFLKIRLSELKTSGKVISLNPQNIIDGNRAVSGTSATMDDSDSTPNQFVINKEMNEIIRANMAYKLKINALDNNVITYDPEKPEEILAQAPNYISAIIDGAGAFKKSTQKAADALLKQNKNLAQVGYHEKEAITFEGQATGDLKKTGFVFNQAHTRGTDIKLGSNATAVITVSEDGVGELCQVRGRLRDEAQEHILAVTNDSGVKTIEDQVTKSVCIDALNDGKNIFRKLKDEPKALLRKEARQKLLEEDDLDKAIEFFSQKGIKALIITEAEKDYHKPGDYAEANQALRLNNQLTKDALIGQKNKCLALAEELGLTQAKAAIEKLHYSDALLAKLPEYVAPIGNGENELEMEVEVENEQEMEAEVENEQEMEVQVDQENVKEEQKVMVGSYPRRKKNETVHSLRRMTNIPYDRAINFSDSFVPLSRQHTGSALKRDLFDSSQPRVGVISIKRDLYSSNEAIVIGDPLDDIQQRGFYYDLRTNQYLTDKVKPENAEFYRIVSQIKFFDGRSSGYNQVEAQELSQWLKESHPKRMKNHLMNQILQYRYTDRLDFPGSQLDLIFKALGVS